MNQKLPPDAFDAYFALGVDRSYDAIATKFNVSKRTVTTTAKRDDWQGRIRAAEEKAKAVSDQKAVETITAMKDRHLKVYQAIQRKALEALRSTSLDNALQAVRALEMALDGERVLRGEPSDRTAVDIEAVIRREYQTLLLKPGEKEDWGDGR